jgi:antitoxin component HigA of HigAB toxin-antitoxin module
MLKYLMHESGMTQADLARLLGSRSAASLILGGHRPLSKSHIQKTGRAFSRVAGAVLRQRACLRACYEHQP